MFRLYYLYYDRLLVYLYKTRHDRGKQLESVGYKKGRGFSIDHQCLWIIVGYMVLDRCVTIKVMQNICARFEESKFWCSLEFTEFLGMFSFRESRFPLKIQKTIALHSYCEAIEFIKVITKIDQKPNFRNLFLNFIIPIASWKPLNLFTVILGY